MEALEILLKILIGAVGVILVVATLWRFWPFLLCVFIGGCLVSWEPSTSPAICFVFTLVGIAANAAWCGYMNIDAWSVFNTPKKKDSNKKGSNNKGGKRKK